MTKQCNEVLRLIDKGYSYKDALNTVLRDEKSVYGKTLEDEVESQLEKALELHIDEQSEFNNNRN